MTGATGETTVSSHQESQSTAVTRPSFYTAAETAEILRLDESTLYRHLRTGHSRAQDRRSVRRTWRRDRAPRRRRARDGPLRRPGRLDAAVAPRPGRSPHADRRPERAASRRRGGRPMSSVFEHLDQAVQRVACLRDELLADECAPDRAARLAAVFDAEARGVVAGVRAVALRLVWRAALAAEAGARANAALWARRAAAERAGGPGHELGCRSGGCTPPGGPHHHRCWGWSVMHSVGALILFCDAGCGDLREGAGRGRGDRVRADRAGAVRVDPGRVGAAARRCRGSSRPSTARPPRR